MKQNYPKTLFILLLTASLIIITTIEAWAFDRHKLSISIGGGWNHYEIQNLSNTEITFPDNQTSAFLWGYTEKLTGGTDLSSRISYKISDNFSIDGVIIYYNKQQKKYNNPFFLDDYLNRASPFYKILKVYLLAPGIGLGYKLPFHRLSFILSSTVNCLYGRADYCYAVGGRPPYMEYQNIKYSGSGLGADISLRLHFKANRILDLNPEIGYRYFPIKKLKDNAGYTWEGMHLNFSGPFAGLNLSFRL